MKLYLDSGYLDIERIINIGVPFIFVMGGRGTGKTYGALEHVIENEIQFMLLRRTQTQTDMINIPEFSPFKKLNSDKGWCVETKKISKHNAGIYFDMDEGGLPMGYTGALSTIANMRGFDASDVELVIYDEFIPESHERPLKNEASALWNAQETINRNRELTGEKPVTMLCLANSNDIANPIFMDLGIIRKITQMVKRGQSVYINRDLGLAVIYLRESPISERKRDTALYKLKKGSQFVNMALDNNFNNEVAGKIKSKNLREYRPIVAVGELCIYEHKHSTKLYATTHKSGKYPQFGMGDIERTRFMREWRYIWLEYLDNNIEFEDYNCEILLTHAFK